MAGDDEPYKPLWAAALEPPPAPPAEELPAPAAPIASGFSLGLPAALVTLFTVLLAAAIFSARSGEATIADVPSAWGSAPMTCSTIRVQDRGVTLELFRCRALDGASLPPGVYSSAGTTWNSDIDRRAALEHLISISPSGRLVGQALYVP